MPDELFHRRVIPHQGRRQRTAEVSGEIAREGGGLDRIEAEAIEALTAVDGARIQPQPGGQPGDDPLLKFRCV